MNNNIVNSPVPELERHQRKCSVCRHPERQAIEEAFLHWHSPNQIATEYDLEEASIYRHAHATGLFDRRRPNVRCALENLIERVDEIQEVKPAAVVRAIQAFTRMSKTGEWVEPPRQIIVAHAKVSENPLVPVEASVKTEASPGKPGIVQVVLPELHLSRSSTIVREGEAQTVDTENRDVNTKKAES